MPPYPREESDVAKADVATAIIAMIEPPEIGSGGKP